MGSRRESAQMLEMEQLEREFDIEQFKTVVGELLDVLQLRMGLQLRQLYGRIKQKSGKVIGKDILRLLHLLNQQAEVQKQLDNEISFYKVTIEQLVSKGKNTLTIGQFFVYFVLNNRNKGMVTEEIQEQVSEYKIISIFKLMGLIQSIQKSRNDSRLTRLYVPPDLGKKEEEEETMDMNNAELNEIQRLRTVIVENCVDQGINSKAIGMLDNIKKKLIQDAEEIQRLEMSLRTHESKEIKVNEEFSRLDQIINQKQYIISKIYQENQKYEEEIQLFEQKCRQDFTEAIEKLSEENRRLEEKQIKVSQLYEEASRELEWYKNNYMGISEEYKTFLKQSELQSARIQTQANRKNFQKMKQEINDIYQRMNKLRKENLDLKNKVSDLEIELEARAMTSGHQTDRTFMNLALDERIPINCHEEAKETFLELLRKRSHIEEIEKELCKSISQQRNNSIKLIRTVTKQYFESQMKNQSLTGRFQNENEVNFELKVKQKLNQFDFAGVLASKILRDLTSFVENNCESTQLLRLIFSCIVYAVKSNGLKEKMVMIISSDKLLLCNEALTIKKSIKMESIKQFCFCENIRNWLVIKLKEDSSTQIVIQIGRRGQLLNYFLKNGFLSSQNRIKISFQSEEKIQVHEERKKLSLSTFTQSKSLVENSFNDGENVFEAKINQYYAFLCLSVKVVIVVNPIGILIFETKKNSGSEGFQNRLKLKLILPFAHQMEVIDLSQQKKLKIVYQNLKKSFQLQFESCAEARLAKEKIKFQREFLATAQKIHSSKFLSIFTSFKKMRSVEDQSTIMDY